MSAPGVTDRPEPANGLWQTVSLSGINVLRLAVITRPASCGLGKSAQAASRARGQLIPKGECWQSR